MLRNLTGIFGSAVLATDGELGHVQDVLFDDRSCTVRYLVIETGSWLSSRRVLLSPSVARRLEWDKRVLRVQIPAGQVGRSPDIDAAKPVSRQEEIAMSRHYGWPAYWSMEPPLMPVWVPDKAPNGGSEGDPHLRSAREITTYHATASDGAIGRVDDLIMDDSSWDIRYLVVVAGTRFSGQRLLLSTRWIRSISWPHREVRFIHSRDEM